MYPQVFGKYVLERELSRGGMARVVLATLRGAGGFEKKLVVKQIRDELAFDHQFVRRFVEEAKTTVALSHPNIVPVYELGVEQGTYFLAMELVEGVSIAELVRDRDEDGKKRVLSPEEGAYVGMEVCRALEYAHRRMKVVHRDITPRNVMIDEEGQVKLIDFGIAAPARVAGHEILGSPGHMPPEQVDGKELGPPTDVFAVAVLLVEAWSGSAPFRRGTPEECDAAMREPHPRASDADPRLLPLDDAIARAMKLDPRERQQQAGELGRALRGFLQGVDVSDVARALGDRVRSLRERLDELGPASGMSGPRLPNPSQLELGTKTFAARADDWSPSAGKVRVVAESDGLVDTPRTRKLADSIPPPDVARARRSAAEGRRPDPAMSVPTPLMVDPAEALGAIASLRASRAEDGRAAGDSPAGAGEAGSPAAARRGGPAAGDRRPSPSLIETIATRPLETPVRLGKEKVERAPPRGHARRWVAAGALALLVAGASAAFRARSTGAAREGALAPSPAGGSSTAPGAVSGPTGKAPAADAMASPSAPPLSPSGHAPEQVASAAPSAGAAAAGAPAAAAASRAQATFVGDPGTRVSIDGASKGACPVRVALEPGVHDVRFVFDPTGESRGERLTVKAGERVTVRADFTGATPTVRVHR